MQENVYNRDFGYGYPVESSKYEIEQIKVFVLSQIFVWIIISESNLYMDQTCGSKSH